jgi:elongation factor G
MTLLYKGGQGALPGIPRGTRRAGTRLLPLEVVTENTDLGDIIGDVNRRRGQVIDQGQKGMQATVQGLVPLAEMFGYINFLRSTTSGRGTFSMEFAHYAEVPAGLVDKLMEKEDKGAK